MASVFTEDEKDVDHRRGWKAKVEDKDFGESSRKKIKLASGLAVPVCGAERGTIWETGNMGNEAEDEAPVDKEDEGIVPGSASTSDDEAQVEVANQGVGTNGKTNLETTQAASWDGITAGVKQQPSKSTPVAVIETQGDAAGAARRLSTSGDLKTTRLFSLTRDGEEWAQRIERMNPRLTISESSDELYVPGVSNFRNFPDFMGKLTSLSSGGEGSSSSVGSSTQVAHMGDTARQEAPKKYYNYYTEAGVAMLRLQSITRAGRPSRGDNGDRAMSQKQKPLCNPSTINWFREVYLYYPEGMWLTPGMDEFGNPDWLGILVRFSPPFHPCRRLNPISVHSCPENPMKDYHRGLWPIDPTFVAAWEAGRREQEKSLRPRHMNVSPNSVGSGGSNSDDSRASDNSFWTRISEISSGGALAGNSEPLHAWPENFGRPDHRSSSLSTEKLDSYRLQSTFRQRTTLSDDWSRRCLSADVRGRSVLSFRMFGQQDGDDSDDSTSYESETRTLSSCDTTSSGKSASDNDRAEVQVEEENVELEDQDVESQQEQQQQPGQEEGAEDTPEVRIFTAEEKERLSGRLPGLIRLLQQLGAEDSNEATSLMFNIQVDLMNKLLVSPWFQDFNREKSEADEKSDDSAKNGGGEASC